MRSRKGYAAQLRNLHRLADRQWRADRQHPQHGRCKHQLRRRALDKTKDFSAASQRQIWRRTVADVISLRELIESFDKKSDAALNEARKC